MIFYLTVCKPLSILTGHILLHILFALHYLTALPILANGPLLKIYLAINFLTPRDFFIKMFSPLSYSQSEIALIPTPSFFPPPPPTLHGEEHCVAKQKRLRGRLGQWMMVKKTKTGPQASSDKNPIIFETTFYHFFLFLHEVTLITKTAPFWRGLGTRPHESE